MVDAIKDEFGDDRDTAVSHPPVAPHESLSPAELHNEQRTGYEQERAGSRQQEVL